MKQNPIIVILAAACLVALIGAGCSERAKTAYNLAAADRFYDSGQFDKAETEYLNALRAEPGNAKAIGRLGLIYFDEGRFEKAAPYLFRGSELSSSNLELRVKLGQIYLAVGELKQAHEQADFVLKSDPTEQDAAILLAQSTPPGQIADLQQELSSLVAKGDSPALETARGILATRQNNFKSALEYFQRAINLNSRFAATYAALGNTYLQFNQLKKAEDAFKAASDCAPPTSPLQTEFGEFEIQMANFVAAGNFFKSLTQKAPDYMPGWLGVAEVALDEKKLADSSAALKTVLDRDPQNADALVLHARLDMARSDTTNAIAELEHLASLYRQAPKIHFQLALAYIMGQKVDQAMNQLHETVDLEPNFPQAAFLLAQLEVQRGDLESALGLLKPLVLRQPDLVEPKLLLADVYRLQNNFSDAMAIYHQLEKALPNNLNVLLLAGSTEVQQFNEDAARADFNRVLQMDPGNVSAQEELVQLDLADKKFNSAQQRAETLVSKNPRQSQLQILLAKVFLERGQTNLAEDALLKAASLPEGLEANLLLSQLYFNLKDDKDALDMLNIALVKKPDDLSVLLFAAVIQSDQKDYAGAAATYKRLLAINPKYSPALNNLAWLYCDHLGDLGKAYTLAQQARQLLPNDPSIADTMGWILFKRGDYTSALNLFVQSASGLPNNPEVQFHLGVAYYMLGNGDAARQQLLNANSLAVPFADRAECQKYLDILNVDPATADAATRAKLEKAIAAMPNDPIAFNQLAAIYERDKNTARATELCQAVLKANPKNVKAMVLLAQLSEGQNPQRAFDIAKAAYQLTPNDPNVCATLGHLALVTGNDQWAFSLLDEASQDEPTNGQTLFDLAKAAFCLGKMAEAHTDMQNASQSGLSTPQAALARNFLDMITVCENPNQAIASQSRIENVLAAEPDNPAALVAEGMMDTQNNNPAGAERAYEDVLGRHPDCTIACKNLAVLYAQNLVDPKTAYPIALRAREAFPDDAEVARALAMILFRQGDYNRAADIFNTISNTPTADARLFYCLGICEYHLKNYIETKTSLEHALTLNLSGPEAVDARQTLSELH
jgi:tetratricopeptide (TPR) repeat protein